MSDQMAPRVVVLRDNGELRVVICKPNEDDPTVWGVIASGFPTVEVAKKELRDIRRRQYGIPRER